MKNTLKNNNNHTLKQAKITCIIYEMFYNIYSLDRTAFACIIYARDVSNSLM